MDTFSPHVQSFLDSERMPWIQAFPGLSVRPLHYFPDGSGYVALLRIEPGTLVAKHRHTGEIHAFNIKGKRRLIETDEIVGPGGYVYEPPGNHDSWMAVGDEPCIAHIVVNGDIEFLDAAGNVMRRTNAATVLEEHRRYCAEHGLELPHLQR